METQNTIIVPVVKPSIKTALRTYKIKDPDKPNKMKTIITNRIRVQLHTGNQSNVQVNQQADTEIKAILKKYQHTGELPAINNKELFEDFSEVVDFQTSQNILATANEQFDALDSITRKRFANDPAEFLKFMSDPNHQEESYKLGLRVKPEPEPKPEPVEVVINNPATPPEGGSPTGE